MKLKTRKRALHARRSHSEVCNTTVSTKAGYTLSVVCGTLTEHTLVKLEIKSVTVKIFIWHDS